MAKNLKNLFLKESNENFKYKTKFSKRTKFKSGKNNTFNEN